MKNHILSWVKIGINRVLLRSFIYNNNQIEYENDLEITNIFIDFPRFC